MKKLSSLVLFGILGIILISCSDQVPVLEDPSDDVLQSKEVSQSVAGSFSADDPIWGESSAPLKMVLFSDFQCPFCKQTANFLEELEEDWISSGKLQVQFRDFPLAKHKNSLSAHVAASAAHAQGRYMEMHRQLYATQSDWIAYERPDEFFTQTAELLGFDEERFQKDYNNPNAISEIKDDRDTGRTWGLTGVPAFYLNGELFQGALTKEAMETVLENAEGL
jgi:protein-disulfide isomerase